MFKKSLISAALLGGTFSLLSPSLMADVPIVQSQADHVASSEGAVPLNRQTATAGPSSALIETLLFQVEELQTQMSEQRGVIEELNYQLQVLQQEQKERYVDLDRRMQSLQEQANSRPAAATVETLSDDQQVALTDEDILAEYNAATALMQKKNSMKPFLNWQFSLKNIHSIRSHQTLGIGLARFTCFSGMLKVLKLHSNALCPTTLITLRCQTLSISWVLLLSKHLMCPRQKHSIIGF